MLLDGPWCTPYACLMSLKQVEQISKKSNVVDSVFLILLLLALSSYGLDLSPSNVFIDLQSIVYYASDQVKTLISQLTYILHISYNDLRYILHLDILHSWNISYLGLGYMGKVMGYRAILIYTWTNLYKAFISELDNVNGR